MTPQTSDTNPLRIATVPFGRAGGLLGLTFAPGKQQGDGATAWHRRDLGTDLDTIAAWNAAAVVTLVEVHELEALRIASIGSEVRRRHMEWHHWAIGDYQVPGADFLAAWPGRSAMLRGLLARGGRVLVHCKGGLGRAGSVAARLLVEDGMAPDATIAAVRAARPGAIETPGQKAWVAAGQSARCWGWRWATRWGRRSSSNRSRGSRGWTTCGQVGRIGCSGGSGRTIPPWRWRWPRAWWRILGWMPTI